MENDARQTFHKWVIVIENFYRKHKFPKHKFSKTTVFNKNVPIYFFLLGLYESWTIAVYILP